MGRQNPFLTGRSVEVLGELVVMMEEFQVALCYSPDFSVGRVTLHVFGDGSEKAYGAVIFVVTAKWGKDERSR